MDLSKLGRSVRGPGAALLAAVAWLLDIKSSSALPIGLLYVLVLLLAGVNGSLRGIRTWAGVCCTLAILSYSISHLPHPDIQSISTLALCLLVVLLTAALLSSRLKTSRVEIGVERAERKHQSDTEIEARETIRHLNQKLEEQIQEQTRELTHARWRYRSLFKDKNLGVVELDFVQAKARLETLRTEGVADLNAHFHAHPHILKEILSTVRMVAVNETFAKIFGYQDGGKFLLYRRPFDNMPGGREVLIRHLEEIFAGNDSFSGTMELRRLDQSRIVVAYAVNLSAEGVSNATVVDISERETAHEMFHAAQDELARADRTATIDAFSVSIAHELNQPLASMSVDVATCLRFVGNEQIDREALARILNRIGRNTTRISDIIGRVRDRLRNRRREAEPVKICTLLEDTKSLLDREANVRHANLITHCTVGLQPVFADPVELQQVLINLIVNALDAMAVVPVEQRRVDLYLDRDGPEKVRIRIADSGPGISEENLERIFAPFFTTKTHGMGMGLQICSTIVEALGGELRAYNGSSGGAVFEFSLSTVQGNSHVLGTRAAAAASPS